MMGRCCASSPSDRMCEAAPDKVDSNVDRCTKAPIYARIPGVECGDYEPCWLGVSGIALIPRMRTREQHQLKLVEPFDNQRSSDETQRAV